MKDKKAFNKVSLADVFVFFIITALVTIIPVMSVLTLTPKLISNEGVLGATYQNYLTFNIYQTTDSIYPTNIKQINDNTYFITTYLKPYDKNYYSQNLIRIENNSQNVYTISISGKAKTSTNSRIGYVYNNTNYITSVEDNNYSYKIKINPNESISLKSLIETPVITNYYQKVTYTLTVE